MRRKILGVPVGGYSIVARQDLRLIALETGAYPFTWC